MKLTLEDEIDAILHQLIVSVINARDNRKPSANVAHEKARERLVELYRHKVDTREQT